MEKHMIDEETILKKQEEMVKEAYKQQMLNIKNEGYKGIVKTQKMDKAAELYLEQKKDIARRRRKLWLEKQK